MSIATIKKSIRKALEVPLYDAAVAAELFVPNTTDPAIQFENFILGQKERLEEYLDHMVVYAPSLIIEMGPHPRIQGGGFVLINVRTKLGTGSDRNDTLAGIVGAAYPYNASLVRDGVEVVISKTDVRQGAPDGAWWQVPILVDWNLWRTT